MSDSEDDTKLEMNKNLAFSFDGGDIEMILNRVKSNVIQPPATLLEVDEEVDSEETNTCDALKKKKHIRDSP